MSAFDPAVPEPLRASRADLPAGVADALDAADPQLAGARRTSVTVGEVPWAGYEWGDEAAPPFVLVHGVTSNADTFWRIGPAVAAAGRHLVAVDLPGHGRTGHWQGRFRLGETADDLAGYLRAAGLVRPDLAVLGHSWGGMVVAGLPRAGLRPGRLLLLDPPAVPLSALEALTRDPLERPYEHLADALAAIRAVNPGWSDGDIQAKALGLTQFDPTAVLAVLLENGDWDGGLAALSDPAAEGIATWLIRGESRMGGMTAEASLPAFAARIGSDHILTIADAPHSPHRLYPEATVAAILRALA